MIGMREILSEKLIEIASTQKKLEEVADRIDQWESSQVTLEKGTFEALNVSDTIVSLTNEGHQMVSVLQDYFTRATMQLTEQDVRHTAELLKEIHNLFHSIQWNAKHTNEIMHNCDQAVATQREIGETAKNSLHTISESVNCVVACTEMILAEL